MVRALPVTLTTHRGLGLVAPASPESPFPQPLTRVTIVPLELAHLFADTGEPELDDQAG